VSVIPSELATHRFPGADGLPLAYHALGDGPPVVLIHGLFSNAQVNWIKPGHAARLAAAGRRVVMPDLRGHGASAAPHDPAAYPPDILAADGEALLRHLSNAACDLVGYSLGGRTVARMLARGCRPARAVVAGMGLAGLLDAGARTGFFQQVLAGIGHHPRGSPAWMAESFLRTTGGDPAAMRPLLGSFVDTPRDVLAAIDLPVLVLAGVDDQDNGSAADLAALLPQGRLATIPGNHMSAVLRPELGASLADFLG